MKFENRTAVITGAAGRIGRALCEELGKNGVKMALIDLKADLVEKTAENLCAQGFHAKAYALDITKPADVAAVCAQILQDFGKIDILVNNAGRWPSKGFLEMDEECWMGAIDLNLNSVFRMTKAFIGHMVENRYGRIINLGSIAGEVGLPGYSAYAASKAGVIMLTKTLAMEFGKFSITVNSVSPGLIEDKPAVHPGTWLNRNGTADEVARLIAFLCSDDSGFITGVDYTIDGGRILGPKNASY